MIGQDRPRCATLPRRAPAVEQRRQRRAARQRRFRHVVPEYLKKMDKSETEGRALASTKPRTWSGPWYFGDALTDSARLRMQHPKSILAGYARVPEAATRTPGRCRRQK